MRLFHESKMEQVQAKARSVQGDCRICREEDHVQNLLSPCKCSGSIKYIHYDCLTRCIETRNATFCEICRDGFVGVKTRTMQPSFIEFLEQNPEFRVELIFAFSLALLMKASLVCQILRVSDENCLWFQILVLASFISFYIGYMYYYYCQWLPENLQVKVIKAVKTYLFV